MGLLSIIGASKNCIKEKVRIVESVFETDKMAETNDHDCAVVVAEIIGIRAGRENGKKS